MKFIIDFFFPNTCASCNSIIYGESIFCDQCDKKTCYMSNYCSSCCENVPLMDNGKCISCSNRSFIRKSVVLYKYSGAIRAAILKMKFSDMPHLAKTLTHYSKEIILERISGDNIDLIVPVPTNKKTIRIRKYNQSYEIARNLSLILGSRLEYGLLYRKEGKLQKNLGVKARFKNAKMSFSSHERDLSGKTILLVDDVITTGSTAEACANILKNKTNVKHVDAFFLAKTSIFHKDAHSHTNPELSSSLNNILTLSSKEGDKG